MSEKNDEIQIENETIVTPQAEEPQETLKTEDEPAQVEALPDEAAKPEEGTDDAIAEEPTEVDKLTQKKVKKKKALKRLKIALITVACVIVLIVGLCLSTYIPRVNGTDYNSDVVKANPSIVEGTLVSAHRAGRTLAPENTMAAFRACFENMSTYSVDILEFDLHLTADNQLILLHDDTMDRTSDCVDVYGEKKLEPIEKTYEQLQIYNMGYNFEENGVYPYRAEDADLTYCHIVRLQEVLDYVQEQETILGKQIGYIIEIKNGKEAGYKAADILSEIMQEYGITERTVVGTFQGEVSRYLDEKHPEIIRSAGIAEVFGFYASYIFGIPLNNVKYKVLQIPYKDYVLNFGKKGMVDYAHKYGIAVQYWTINKEKDIRHLASIGADAIMSDDPKLAYDVIYGDKK